MDMTISTMIAGGVIVGSILGPAIAMILYKVGFSQTEELTKKAEYKQGKDENPDKEAIFHEEATYYKRTNPQKRPKTIIVVDGTSRNRATPITPAAIAERRRKTT